MERLDDGKAQADPARVLEIERRARTSARVVERVAPRGSAEDRPRRAAGMPAVEPRFVGGAIIPSEQREARVLFGFYNGMLIALHSFIKKRQQTPPEDLTLARQRLKEVLS
jgi:hypothetical protein